MHRYWIKKVYFVLYLLNHIILKLIVNPCIWFQIYFQRLCFTIHKLVVHINHKLFLDKLIYLSHHQLRSKKKHFLNVNEFWFIIKTQPKKKPLTASYYPLKRLAQLNKISLMVKLFGWIGILMRIHLALQFTLINAYIFFQGTFL